MKKFYCFMLVFLAITSCFVFSACGDKYSDLSMNFFSQDGVVISSIDLVIDSDDDSDSYTYIGVGFDGIDQSDIGEVKIQSSPAGLVSVSDYTYTGDKVYVKVDANMTGSGSLVVYHLASGKTSSLPINVDKISTNLTLKSTTYVVSIPTDIDDEVGYSVNIDSSSLVSLEPTGSTDKIYYKVTGSVSGVTFNTIDINGEAYVTGFTLASSVAPNSTLTLYPVTYVKGHEVKSYSSEVVTFVFMETITENDIYLQSDSYHQSYLDNGETIYLIANDNTSMTDISTGISYSYNNFQISVKKKEIDNDEGGIITYTYTDFSDFYEVECVSSNSAVNVLNGEYFVIQANEYSSAKIAITISLVPVNCVGDLKTVTKTIYVKCETKSDEILAYLEGGTTEIDLNESVDIYNNYASALGTLFNFYLNSDTAFADLRSMRIVISPNILDTTFASTDGINSIYTDSTFTALADSESITTLLSARSNQYVLAFYINGTAMRFYYDEENYYFISEEIKEGDSVYIKYNETDNGGNLTLKIDIETYYTGNLEYLAEIKGVTTTIKFNMQEGVTAMTVNAGYITEDGSVKIDLYTASGGGYAEIETLNLNILDENLYAIYIDPDKVYGENNVQISNAKFSITVSGSGVNPLKIWQYNGSLDVTGTDTITFTASTDLYNAILLIFDENTTCGTYTITITAGNGYTRTITAYVYRDLEEGDIGYTLTTYNNAFSNLDGEGEYIYSDYTADYIVAAGLTLDLDMVLENVVDNNIIKAYSFSASWVGSSGENIDDYITITNNGTSAQLKTLQGTYFNSANYYITITLSVEVYNYANIIATTATTKTLSIEFTIFIYKEITSSDITISDTNISLYMSGLLGAYYTDQATAEISVNLTDESLWNYVQKQEQSADYNIGISSITYTETETDGEGNETPVTKTEPAYYSVTWYTLISNEVGNLITTDGEEDNSIQLTFGTNSSAYSYVIYAYVYQFNNVFTLSCRVVVNKPIITENLVINSEVEVYDEGGYYIDLKAGDEYVIDVTNISSLGTVTNPDVYILILDATGNKILSSDVTLEDFTLTVADSITATDLKLVIIAKDALKNTYLDTTSRFSNIASLLMDDYKSAYLEIDLILSDGTENHPYLINDADDFYAIKDGDTSYYKIMADINLATASNSARTIEDFAGTIYTDDDKTYSIYGFTLNEDLVNLFNNFNGTIENVNFVVKYNYNITDSSTDYMFGVFGQVNEDAIITNVAVQVSGSATLDVTSFVYFGGLVGYNDGGEITYTTSAIGAQGSINISGSATKVYFGGLVGYNSGTITGYLSTSDNSTSGVVFTVYVENSASLTSMNIVSTIENTGAGVGGIGGVAGYNSGVIEDAYVSGTILSSGNNVGGIVGVNIASRLETVVNATSPKSQTVIQSVILSGDATANISGVTSVVQIIANNYVGGIVGYSEGGYFANSKYQILASYNYGVQGNDYVGGIAGYSYDGIFEYCSVMSYRWDYNLLNSTDYASFASTGDADIIGANYVSGIVGGAKNTKYVQNSTNKTDITPGVNNGVQLVSVLYSGVNAYISGEDNVSGLISNINENTASGHYISIAFNAYFIGRLSSGSSDVNYEEITGDDSTKYYLAVSNDTFTDYNYVYTVTADEVGLHVGNFLDVPGGFATTEDQDIYYEYMRYYYYSYLSSCADGTYDRSATYYDENGDVVTVADEAEFESLKTTLYVIIVETDTIKYKYYSCENLTYDSTETYRDENGDVVTVADEAEFESKKSDLYIYVKVKVWEYNSGLNGGFIYLLDINGDPLFDVAPTSVSAEIKDTTYADFIHLDYYDFNLSTEIENYSEIYSALTEKYNTYSIMDLLSFSYEPSDLSGVRLMVSSSDSSVIRVNGDEIIVCGVGQAQLTFTSVLNSSVSASVMIDVAYKQGDSIILSESAVDSTLNIDDSTQNLTAGDAKLYYIISTGTTRDGYSVNGISLDGYTYTADSEMYLKVYIAVSSGTLDKDSIADYIQISGLTWETNETDLYVIVDPTTPFSVSVLKYCEGVTFTITIEPYTIISCNGASYDNFTSNTISFNVVTYKGATNLSLSYEAVTLYPNDTTIVNAYVTTDIAYDLTEGDEWAFLTTDVFSDIIVSLIDEDGNVSETLDETKYVAFYKNMGYDDATGLQTIKFKVTINDELTISQELTLRITFVLKNGVKKYVEFTVLPQRINTIEIKNYIFDDADRTSITQSSVLRPTSGGLIIIDISPINGYFDYLEISDITGNEEILFTQVNSGYNVLSLMDDTSSDGKGIKLIKVDSESSIYVSTIISSSYSSKMHTIRVTAYLADGTAVSETFTYTIEVKMLPIVSVEYVDPNGDTVFSIEATTTKTDIDTHYLANAVDANFYISTKNTNGGLDITLSLSGGYTASNYYSLYEVNSGYYILEYIGAYATGLLGETLTITLSTTTTDTNGDKETTSVTFSFTIVTYVIHNISVSHSKITSSYGSSYLGEIYGDYGESTNTSILFYLKPTDISFYDTRTSSFWGTTYNYADENLSNYADEEDLESANDYALHEIYIILYQLNNSTNNLSVDANNTSSSKGYITIEQSTDDFACTLNGNALNVTAGKGSLTLAFTLYLDKYWNFSILYDTEKEYYGEISYSYNYYINFTTANSYEDPTVIYTAEEFLSMASGDDVYYMLACDIELSDYTPIDVDIRSFDGNGFKITIKSFASSTDDTLSLGLFSQIYEDMMILNLHVEYNIGTITTTASSRKITYTDLCLDEEGNSVEHSALNFGGISPVNNGIISNCEVSGILAISASTVEANSSGYSVSIYVGGITEENTSTGYITNSICSLEIYGMLNAGGIAYSNAGKIVSSAFDGGVINAYNSSVLDTIIVNVAGFVVENTSSGSVSMSYVDLETVKIGSTTYGALSVKDVSAGFVFNNSGNIYDCYVDLYKVYGYNNTFSGFVNTNSGTISTCYAYTNSGVWNSQIVYMFAPEGTEGITDSYELVITTAGYDRVVAGVTTLSQGLYLQSSYSSFNFGDNESAVWEISSGNLPKLVATQETIALNGRVYTEDDIVYYAGIKTITRRTDIEYDDEGNISLITYTEDVDYSNYGTESDPYLIYDVDTWDYYFNYKPYAYFRLITDIDFSEVYSNVSTSTLSFSGNIQGNNMILSNIVLYSASSLQAIGLFKELVSANDIEITNSVRNLTLKPSSILATRTTMVGVLAGLVEDFNLYNINIDASDVIVVGGNAVGGVAGVVRGNFDISGITSNVGANSTRSSDGNTYNIYISKNNSVSVSSNLTSVYYAGSAFGILDGYSAGSYSIDSVRNLVTGTYFSAQGITITSNSSILGDTVGGAIGFVGERVRVSNVTVEYAGALSGYQYSAGVVGENRGVIENATFTATSDGVFSNSESVSAGIVGLNLGGFVDNSTSSFNFTRTASSAYTVAGVVGRNVNGYVLNSSFDGEILAYYTGGIIGSDYSKSMLTSYSSGKGAINSTSQVAIPADSLTYYSDSGELITNIIENCSISLNTLQFWFENMTKFYYYESSWDTFNEGIKYVKVLGLAIGISDSEDTIYNYGYNASTKTFEINVDSPTNLTLGAIDSANLIGGVNYDIPYSNVITSISGLSYTYVTYVLGAKVSSFDTWTRAAYYSERVVFTNQTVSDLELLDSDDSSITAYIKDIDISDANEGYAIRIYSDTLKTLNINYSYLGLSDATVEISANNSNTSTCSTSNANVEFNDVSLTGGITVTLSITTEDEDENKTTDKIVFTIG